MAKFTTEAKVGVFVLLVLAMLAYISVKIGGFKVGVEEGYQLTAVFDNVSGLKKGVSVEIAGIEVGKVTEISLYKNLARVTMTISPKIKLTRDTTAVIRTRGVLGDKYMALVPGAAEGPFFKSGDRIVNARTPADADQIINQIGDISRDIKKVTQSLGGALGGDRGEAEIKRILENFRELSQNLATLSRDNSQNLNKLIANLTEFSADLKNLTKINKDNINATLAGVRITSDRLGQTVAALQRIAEKIDQGQGTVGALVNDQTTVKDLNKTLASLRDISDKINRGKGTVGRLVNEPKTADRLDDALDGINDFMTKANALKIFIDYRGDWLFSLNQLKSTLNLRIQPREDTYYLLGITSDASGTYKKSDRIITVNGVPQTVTEETWDRGDLRFNAQIAKRYYDFVLRGGLIESGGGVGFDYYLLDNLLKLTFEASAGDVYRNAHLKVGAEYNLWKIFYVTAGYDDIISDQGNDSPYLGFGLTINEDDLKYLLTSVPLPTGR